MEYSILDIDIDYFNLVDDPDNHLREMLKWARCPVALAENSTFCTAITNNP